MTAATLRTLARSLVFLTAFGAAGVFGCLALAATAPQITLLSPNSKAEGSSGFTLTVNGTDFEVDSVVRFDGSDRATTYITSTQLTAFIPAGNLAVAGTFNVTVSNPLPGGGTSNSLTFTVTDSTAPLLAEVTPAPSIVGSNSVAYAFSSSEAGTISYFGSCAAPQTAAVAGDNTVTFMGLSEGLHDDCEIRVTDASSNQSDPLHVSAFEVDTIAPTVLDVSSTHADGNVTTGQTVQVQVTFSEPVTVTGSPTLALSTKAPAVTNVGYVAGPPSATITFEYLVAVGNASNDLDYADASALALNGGAVKDAAGNDAALILPAPGASGSLGANKAITVNKVLGGGSGSVQPPQVTLVDINGGTFNAGQSVTLIWSSGGSGIASYRLSLSTNGGATWSSVAAGLTTNTYAWQLPSVATAAARFRVEALNAGGSVVANDVSDGNFTIMLPSPSIRLNAPNGGETYAAGSPFSFPSMVTASSHVVFVRFTLSMDGGVTYPVPLLTQSVTSSTTTIQFPPFLTTAARVKVEGLAANGTVLATDTSDANFTLCAGTGCAFGKYRWRNDDGDETSATAAVPEDTPVALAQYQVRRLRMKVPSGRYDAGQLESAQKNGTCATTTGWTSVGAWSFVLANSAFLADNAASTDVPGLLSDDPAATFVPGRLEPANPFGAAIGNTLPPARYSEHEWSLQPTNKAIGAYCFRLRRVGSAPLPAEDMYAEAIVLPAAVTVGGLVKLANDTAIYYVGNDGKRHPFPTAAIFETWYPDYGGVQTISPADMASLQLGDPVLVRPGTKWVKVTSDPKTYFVSEGNKLRWIKDQATAEQMWGAGWSGNVLDVDPTLFTKFGSGADIDAASLATDWPAGSVVKAGENGKRLRFGVANDGTQSVFTTKDSVTFAPGFGGALTTLLDVTNGFAYVKNIGPTVVKVRLSDMKEMANLSLSPGGTWSSGGAIDATNGYAYFLTGDKVVKVDINPAHAFAEVSTYAPSKGTAQAIVIDPANDLGYVAAGPGGSGWIIRVKLSTFAEQAVIPTAGGRAVTGATIDVAGGYAYFGTSYWSSGKIFKVDINPAHAFAVTNTWASGDAAQLLIDPSKDFGVAKLAGPLRIVKFKLSDLSLIDSLPLLPDENDVWSSDADMTNGYVYYGLKNATVIKVDVDPNRTFQRVGAPLPITATNPAPFSVATDPKNGYVYVGIWDRVLFRMNAAPTASFRLEYATKTASCAAATAWTQVAAANGTGSEHWQMADLDGVVDGSLSANLASLPDGNVSFQAGGLYDTSSQARPIALGEKQFSEVEFSVRPTHYASLTDTYCFRLTDAGAPTPLAQGTFAEATVSAAPPSMPTTSVLASIWRKSNGTDAAAVNVPVAVVSGDQDVYYLDGTTRRAFASPVAFGANRFQARFTMLTPGNPSWLSRVLGSPIAGFEGALFALTQ